MKIKDLVVGYMVSVKHPGGVRIPPIEFTGRIAKMSETTGLLAITPDDPAMNIYCFVPAEDEEEFIDMDGVIVINSHFVEKVL